MLEEIEEQKISSASVYEVASLLLGPVGTRVKLKIRRRNTGGYNRKVIYTVDIRVWKTSGFPFKFERIYDVTWKPEQGSVYGGARAQTNEC